MRCPLKVFEDSLGDMFFILIVTAVNVVGNSVLARAVVSHRR